MINQTDSWLLNNLPFYWAPLNKPSNGHEIPDYLSFELDICETTGRIIQKSNKEVSRALETAYSTGSMFSGMMDKDGIGKSYADDFIPIIVEAAASSKSFSDMNILEIGCGTGYLLKRLRDMGAKCTGIEPGNHAIKTANKYDVDIINDYYPSKNIRDKYDLIIHYGVLEHIEDPITFLKNLSNNLKPSGQIILSVPNVENSIRTGDISMVFHEHFSYFNMNSLYNTLTYGGLDNINIMGSRFGRALYASGKVGTSNFKFKKCIVMNEFNQFTSYKNKVISNTEYISGYIEKIANMGNTLGIYVPLRLMNTIAIRKINLSHCRFFDDNRLLHGTYLPGINIPIESREMLINKPTDSVLIASDTFGQKILKHIVPLLPSPTEVTLLGDLTCS